MSGGVDSAVAARLAAERGDDVVAVTLELWADPAVDTTRSCCSSQAVAGARALAHRMGMPHLTLDLREPFGDRVVADFVVRAPRRPHAEPVRALQRACCASTRCSSWPTGVGAARLATGHYARVERDADGPVLALRARPHEGPDLHARRASDRPARARLVPARGPGEDRGQGARARAPACRWRTSPTARTCASSPASGGKEAFLRRHAADLVAADRGGDIVDARRPRRRAPHRPAPLHDRPAARARDRRARSRCTWSTRTRAAGASGWGRGTRCGPHRVTVRAADLHRPAAAVDRVKLRYRSDPLAGCVAEPLAPGRHPRLTLELAEPAEGVAPGQTACLMQGDRIIGWGVIGAGQEAHAAA